MKLKLALLAFAVVTIALLSRNQTPTVSIWVSNSDQLVEVTGDRQIEDAYSPSISPDGKSMIVSQGQAGILTLLNLDDLTTEWAFASAGLTTVARWSPNGELIAFGGIADGQSADLWLINANGSNPRLIMTHAIVLNWIDDANLVVYSRERETDLWRFNINGSLTQLTDIPAFFRSDTSIWGNQIAFDTFDRGVFITSGSDTVMVDAKAKKPAFSNNGDLAYVRYLQAAAFELVICHNNESKVVYASLTDHPPFIDQLRWGADGRLYFILTDRNTADAKLMSMDENGDLITLYHGLPGLYYEIH